MNNISIALTEEQKSRLKQDDSTIILTEDQYNSLVGRPAAEAAEELWEYIKDAEKDLARDGDSVVLLKYAQYLSKDDNLIRFCMKYPRFLIEMKDDINQEHTAAYREALKDTIWEWLSYPDFFLADFKEMVKQDTPYTIADVISADDISDEELDKLDTPRGYLGDNPEDLLSSVIYGYAGSQYIEDIIIRRGRKMFLSHKGETWPLMIVRKDC